MTRNKLSQSTQLLLNANPNIIYIRDGEIDVYRRSASPLYQYRYKSADGKWHHFSARKANVENAVSVAYLLYDKARFRQRLGLDTQHKHSHSRQIKPSQNYGNR